MEMTREEKVRRLKELKLEKLKRERAARQQTEALPERTIAERGRDYATGLGQGALFNFADEITGAIGATMGGLGTDESGMSWNERRKDITDAERARYDQYLADRPGEAFAGEMIGGIATGKPVSLVRSLTKTAAKAAEKKLAKEAIMKAEQTPWQEMRRGILRNTGSGMAQGAAAGYGASDGTTDVSSTLLGAGIGAAIPLGMSGGRTLAKTMGRRRIAQELGKGPDAMPIHLAAAPKESWVADKYREVMGQGLVTRPQMAALETKYLKGVEDKVMQAEGAVEAGTDLITQKGREAAALGKAVGRQKEDAIMQLEQDMGARKAQITDQFDTSAKAAQDKLDQLAEKATRQKDLLAEMPGVVATRSSEAFRNLAKQAALPESVPESLRTKIAHADPRQAAELIDNWWSKEGFNVVKDKAFKWEGGDLSEALQEAMQNTGVVSQLGDIAAKVPSMAESLQKNIMKYSKTMSPDNAQAKALLEAFKNPTHISGEAMMELRNVFARKANGPASYAGKQHREVSKIFDDAIRKGLDGDELKDFNDQIRRYGTARNYGKAVDRAEEGIFSEKDWLDAGKKNLKSRYGKGPLQREAETSRRASTVLKEDAKAATKAISRNEKKVGKTARREAQQLVKSKAAELDRVAAELKTKKADLRRAAQDNEPQAALKREIEGLKDAQTQRQRGLAKAKKAQAEMKARQIAIKPSLAQQSIATGLSLFGGGTLGTSMNVQRAAAGQTGWQKAGQKLYAKSLGDSVTARLLRGGTDRTRNALIRERAATAGDQ